MAILIVTVLYGILIKTERIHLYLVILPHANTNPQIKIHRAVITEANLNYVGSLTLDEDLMDAANLIGNEKIQ